MNYKKIIMTSSLSLLIAAFGVNVGAQTVNSTTNSSALTASTSGAMNAGNAQSIHFNTDNSGTSTLKTTPMVAGNSFYGSFSSDFCFGSEGGSLSVLTAGGSIVKMTRDEVCTAMRIFERLQQGAASVYAVDPKTSAKMRQASIDVICLSSDIARQALQNQGLCSTFTQTAVATAAQPLDAKNVKQTTKLVAMSDFIPN